MPTKAELEAELADLRAAMDDRAEATQADEEEQAAEGGSALGDLLAEHGFEGGDLDSLLAQFSKELGNLPQHKPLLTALGAFALGFAAGRMSK